MLRIDLKDTFLRVSWDEVSSELTTTDSLFWWFRYDFLLVGLMFLPDTVQNVINQTVKGSSGTESYHD